MSDHFSERPDEQNKNLNEEKDEKDKGGPKPNTAPTSRFRNLIIIGLTGSGKSSLGEMLANALRLGFVDTDSLIEKRAKLSIADIFAHHGEDRFREMEASLIQDLSSIRNHVIAVGGGTIMQDENWQALKKMGVLIWLKSSPEEVMRRLVMKPDQIRRRPLLADLVNEPDKTTRGEKLVERLRALASQREKRFLEAEVAVDDSFSTLEIAVHQIRTALKRKGLL